MKLKSGGRHFSLRAVVSTLVGEGADSLIFFPIAFVGIIGMEDMLRLMAVQIVGKTLYEIAVLPITIRVVKFVKRYESTDIYDNDVSYNILKVKDL